MAKGAIMILLCGGTGDLGGRVARLLDASQATFTMLVRQGSSRKTIARLGAEIVTGDLTDPTTLRPALEGVDTVITTANAIGRMLEGAKDVSIRSVDRDGNVNLIDAAQRAGVRRFVFVSMAGINAERARLAPLGAAKLAAESHLLASSMQAVIVRPDKFQEVWLSPATGIEPAKGRVRIFGKGQLPQAFVAEDDVAALTVRLALEPNPAEIVEFGGSGPLSSLEVAEALGSVFGRTMKVTHVPRPLLRVGATVLSKVKPEVASLMGMALCSDLHPITWTDEPLISRGIRPRSTGEYLAMLATDSAEPASDEVREVSP